MRLLNGCFCEHAKLNCTLAQIKSNKMPTYPHKITFASINERFNDRTIRKKTHRDEKPGQTSRNSRSQNTLPEIPVVRVGPGQTSTFFSSDTWKSIGAEEFMVQALNAVGVSRPSHIQAAAFRAFSSQAPHIALADHAGSGKTLSYLVPLIQSLKGEEIALGSPGTIPRAPRYIIIVPTSELCAQVLRVCRALSSTLRFRSAAATGGRPIRTQREALQSGVDILIGTPGRLAELLEDGALHLDRCAAIVCDEVDVLLGQAFEFSEQIRPLRDAAPPSTRFVLVTATLPASTYSDLELSFPGLVAALGPGLHRTAPGVIEQIIDCSGGDEITEESGIQRKCTALLASIQEQRAARTIVFCNKISTCRTVENFLNRSFSASTTGPVSSMASREHSSYTDTDMALNEDVPAPRGARDADNSSSTHVKVLPYHAAIDPEKRERNLKEFLLPPATPHNKNQRNDVHGVDYTRAILVCTDRASRGVDSAYVEHVVLFDFPRDPSEYVRRVGRTARGAGGRGTVTVLVLGRQVKLAQEVIGRNQKGLPVHALPSVMPVTVRSTASKYEGYRRVPTGEVKVARDGDSGRGYGDVGDATYEDDADEKDTSVQADSSSSRSVDSTRSGEYFRKEIDGIGMVGVSEEDRARFAADMRRMMQKNRADDED